MPLSPEPKPTQHRQYRIGERVWHIVQGRELHGRIIGITSYARPDSVLCEYDLDMGDGYRMSNISGLQLRSKMDSMK